MTFWFLPELLPKNMLANEELVLQAQDGIPDLSRAQSRDQIAGWLTALMPDSFPETIAVRTEHYWQLGHELSPEDHVILPCEGGIFRIAEITGVYRFEKRDGKPCHIWPVSWLKAEIPETKLPELAFYLSRGNIVEIKDEKLLARITRYVPSQRRATVTIFKWVSVILLISEFIYFWPR